MLYRLRCRGAHESGAVPVLVSIMMVFLGMAALAIDVGSFHKGPAPGAERRRRRQQARTRRT